MMPRILVSAASLAALLVLTPVAFAQRPRDAEPMAGEARTNERAVRRPSPPPPAPVPPPVGVRRETVAGVLRTIAVLPGPIVAVAATEGENSSRALILLTRPEAEPDGPRTLWRLDLSLPDPLTELRGGLLGHLKSLHAADLNGDGLSELLAGGLGTLDRLREDASAPLEPLVRDPGFDARSFAPDRLRLEPWPGFLAAMETGRALFFEPDGAGGLVRRARVALPFEGRKDEAGLLLSSPRPLLLPRAGALPLLGIEAQPSGKRRLKLAVIDPVDATRREGWALLPGPETLNASTFVLLGGQPFAVVLTQSADRLGIFERQQLRVFPLSVDRTQKGRLPSFQADTDAYRWHEVDLAARDLDGDSKDELILVYREGMNGEQLQVEVFPGIGGGKFVVKPRRTKLDVEKPILWMGEHDLTADGRPDLVVRNEAGLLLFAGNTSGFASKPKLTIPLPAPPGPTAITVGVSTGGSSVRTALPDERPELGAIDLDGDGTKELVFLVPNELGRGVLTVVRLGA